MQESYVKVVLLGVCSRSLGAQRIVGSSTVTHSQLGVFLFTWST